MSAAALPRRSTPQANGTRIPLGIPADATEWLRAHFDWTRGAVWVACERWWVDAATVVAWAERLRAGGARAGLGGRERTWIVAQLTDPEQRPTRTERAMARTWARGLDVTPPVAIRSVHDAIALLEVRLADDKRHGDGRTGDPFRALLLDDLRALRDGRSDEYTAVEQREQPTQTERHDEVTATTTAITTATDEASEAREATCMTCGQTFEPWRTGQGLNRKSCKSCFSQRMSEARARRTFPPAPADAPTNAATDAATDAAREPEPASERVPLVFAHQPSSVTGASSLTTITIGAPATTATPAPAIPAPAPTPHGPSPLLTGLLDRLPMSGQWTAAQRERWLRAFTATLDLEVTTEEVATAATTAEGQA